MVDSADVVNDGGLCVSVIEPFSEAWEDAEDGSEGGDVVIEVVESVEEIRVGRVRVIWQSDEESVSETRVLSALTSFGSTEVLSLQAIASLSMSTFPETCGDERSLLSGVGVSIAACRRSLR